MLAAPLLTVLLACSESILVPEESKPTIPLEDDTATVDSGGDSSPPVDTADSAEPPCDVDVPLAGDVPVDGGNPDYWELEPLWELTAPAADSRWDESVTTPLVVQLADDDGDGDVDADDDPDVLVLFADSNYRTGALVALDGATGAEHWTVETVYTGGTFAAADLDADGVTEIVVNGADGVTPMALRADGSTYWRAPVSVTGGYASITAADLDQDGYPELLANGYVLEGQTGVIRDRISAGWGYGVAIGADLDRDGQTEIILDGIVSGSDGSLLWGSGASALWQATAIPVQADADEDGELFTASSGRWEINDTDGTVLATGTVSSGIPGPPCAADLDGDGTTEAVWPVQRTLHAVRTDGTPFWSVTVSDSSSGSGCVTADLDGNGAYEVIYADESSVQIFDGATGTILWEDETHSSYTLLEHPVVADLDHDGSPEIVVVGSAGSTPAVRVWRQVDGAWAPTGSTWPIDDYAETQSDDDGVAVPGGGTPWSDWGGFRGRPPRGPAATACPDLAVSTPEVCLRGCDASPALLLSFQPYNHGGAELSGGRWSLATEGTQPVVVAEGSFGPLASGRSADGVRVEVRPEDLGTADALLLSVYGDDAECDAEDNVVRIEGPFCP